MATANGISTGPSIDFDSYFPVLMEEMAHFRERTKVDEPFNVDDEEELKAKGYQFYVVEQRALLDRVDEEVTRVIG